MGDDKAVLELQITKPLLEQILKENQQLKKYHDDYQQAMNNPDEKKSFRAVIHLVEEGKNSKTGGNEKMEENVSTLNKELLTTKELLKVVQKENQELDVANLNLERQVDRLRKNLRLEEEKNKTSDLANVECKLLKLKLQSIENEKKYLLDEFENERKIMTKQNKPRVAKLEENLKHLRKWIENEAKDRRTSDPDEVKALKAQIHVLERDKTDLIEGFELERKVFQKILKSSLP